MFSTLSVQNATSRKPNLILDGILYLSSNPSTYDSITQKLVDDLFSIDSSVSYEDQLKIWFQNKLGVKAVCFCDITNLYERRQFGRDEVVITANYPAPVYEKIFTIEPQTSLDVVRINISNINSAIDHIGTFEKYTADTILFVEMHKKNSFLIEWINKEIMETETKCVTPKNYVSFSVPSEISFWYSAFTAYNESLNADGYKIWLPQIPQPMTYTEDFFSRPKDIQSKLPKMCFWLTRDHYIMSAAEGFLYAKKIPFLKQLRNDLMNELYPESLSDSISNSEKEESKLDITTKNSQLAKITWQGDKKVLVNALRQLKTAHNRKGQALIKESYEDIALFLIQHINGFENDKISTLRGLLTKELDDPKGNFIPLDLTEPN